MKIIQALKSWFNNDTEKRLALLERNFVVLLKRVLEMDGVKLVPARASELSAKILTTPADDFHKATHEGEPTIH